MGRNFTHADTKINLHKAYIFKNENSVMNSNNAQTNYYNCKYFQDYLEEVNWEYQLYFVILNQQYF